MLTKTFKFSDDREITLKEPTVLQLESAQKKYGKDELGISKALLVDMSGGDLTIDSINSLSVREFKQLLESVKEFIGVDVSD
ncbi:hypothetical protein BKH42_05390 [Helicobacter sp. 13S00482-2]|uniref:phage tail assembly protein n=1 Tax=Helicobacter sp. 13S00482-2 TaxID=1476200 RepID=UPI000BA55C17|nr:phage tail assembly protein [Helicobacter sp. 13S00482-2]PAF53235.1 hypothetical protein BKH42_06825 [Helicobacter sp. 13S00482-2]PAF53485.1 hypothetical protein BKH42_05390 [Helicobacter sp. 13S00482-2]